MSGKKGSKSLILKYSNKKEYTELFSKKKMVYDYFKLLFDENVQFIKRDEFATLPINDIIDWLSIELFEELYIKLKNISSKGKDIEWYNEI